MYFKLFKKKTERERERDESYVSQSVLTLVIHTETFIRVNMLIIIALHKNKMLKS